MERTDTTGSTEAQTDRQFYLPAGAAPSDTTLVERFVTGLFRERGDLLARIRRE
jgi:hypothetical protein